jgi:hypothetical protein
MTLVPPDPRDQRQPEPAVGRPEHWHAMLLELAGRIPDDLLSDARLWLGEGDYDNVALAVAVGSITAAAPVTAFTADLILTQLFMAGEDLDQLPPLDLLTDDPDPATLAWIFLPALVDSGPASEAEVVLDLTVPGAVETLDPVDTAARETAASLPEVCALWRTWRYDPALSFSRRIFIGFAEPGTDTDALPLLTATLQTALAVGC